MVPEQRNATRTETFYRTEYRQVAQDYQVQVPYTVNEEVCYPVTTWKKVIVQVDPCAGASHGGVIYGGAHHGSTFAVAADVVLLRWARAVDVVAAADVVTNFDVNLCWCQQPDWRW